MEVWPPMSLGVGELKIKNSKGATPISVIPLLLIGMSHSLSPFWRDQSAANTQKNECLECSGHPKKQGQEHSGHSKFG